MRAKLVLSMVIYGVSLKTKYKEQWWFVLRSTKDEPKVSFQMRSTWLGYKSVKLLQIWKYIFLKLSNLHRIHKLKY